MKKMKFLFISPILLFVIVSLSSCSIGLKEKKERAYNEGYNSGVVRGDTKAKEDYTALLEKEKKQFEIDLANNKKMYEEKVTEAYNSSYLQGQQSMQNDLNEIIDVSQQGKVKKKSKSDKWDTEVKSN